jgi:hypothetical protein
MVGSLVATLLLGTPLTQTQAKEWLLSTSLSLITLALIFEPLKVIFLAVYWVVHKGSILK